MEQLIQLKTTFAHTKFISWFKSDARHNQIFYQLLFLVFGAVFLDWDKNLISYLIMVSVCVLVQYIGIKLTNSHISGLKSGFISSLSLCLMFSATYIETLVLVSVLTIASKYLIRYKGKHLFNPTNFGIIVTILVAGDGWLSPGAWGSEIYLFFLITMFGMFVLNKVNRLDSALTFLGVFSGLHFIRQVIYLGWEFEVFFHHLSSGTLLLFTFFMMTDPVTTPKSRKGRVIWASLIGLISFVVSNYYYVHTAPIWVLFFVAPLVPLFNKFFQGNNFSWKDSK